MTTKSLRFLSVVTLTAILGIGLAAGIGGPPRTTATSAGTAAVDATKSPNSTFDHKRRTENETNIFAQLDRPASVDFKDTALAKAVEFLAERHKIKIVINDAALMEEGIMTGIQITLSVKNVLLKNVLRLMLRPLNLDYLVRDEVLQITTRAKADEYLETHVYDTTRLKGIDSRILQRTIQNSIPTAVWKDIDGDPNGGTITALPGLMIIAQTQRAHAAVAELLQQLASARKAQETAGVILRSIQPPPRRRSQPKAAGGLSGSAPF